ncbi:unnamed protein product [Ascophyllum nodosum]
MKNDPKAMRMLDNEIKGMKSTNHPNIVRLQEVYRPKNEDMVYLVLDRLSGGSLEALRRHEGRLEEDCAACIIAQVVDAVRYCHDRHIAHRDLKLANCMFEDDSEAPIVKIIDFGLCAKFKYGQTSSAFVGTRAYVAPEVIMKNKGHGLVCDMWSVGVMTYALVGGKLPFPSLDPTALELQIKFKRLSFLDEVWKDVSTECRDFIDKCLTKNPKNRITAAGAQGHAWIRKAEKAMEESGTLLSKEAMLSMMKFRNMTLFEKMAMELIAYTYDPSEIRDLERQFRKMDTDGTGMVTLDGFKKALQRRRETTLQPACETNLSVDTSGRPIGLLDEAEIESLFGAIDLVHCGCISINEFVAACLAKRQIQDGHIKAAFERLDLGMTGLVTPEDASKYLGAYFPTTAITKDMREISSRGDGLVTLEDFTKCMKEYVFKSNFLSAPSSRRSTIESSIGVEARHGLAKTEASGATGLP